MSRLPTKDYLLTEREWKNENVNWKNGKKFHLKKNRHHLEMFFPRKFIDRVAGFFRKIKKNKMYKKWKILERVNRILIKNCSPLHGTLNANK